MNTEINLKITKDENGWAMTGGEFRGGELVGASDVIEAKACDVIAMVTMILMDND